MGSARFVSIWKTIRLMKETNKETDVFQKTLAALVQGRANGLKDGLKDSPYIIIFVITLLIFIHLLVQCNIRK